jgi:hypothetical protein
MGLFGSRGEEEDEQGDISLVGLDDLDGGSDDDEITFELDEWSEGDRRLLRDRLETLGAPHTWEGTTLVVAAPDEAWVERIMDQVEEDLAMPQEEDDEDQVAYDLAGWDDDSCVQLLDALSTEAIPYALDDDELVVAASDEARVDEIVAALTTPGATLTLGGPASFDAMGEMFVAADQLARPTVNLTGADTLVRGARTAATSTAPYGMDTGWWDGVVARAGALADLVESGDPDLDQVADLATELRDQLRPYV